MLERIQLSELELAEYWARAAVIVPTIVVGGGRWARVWATVLLRARKTTQDITLVAHTDPDSVSRWIAEEPERFGLRVKRSLAETLASRRPARLAIIASRPKDHYAHAVAAMKKGIDVLVEKPLGVTSYEVRKLLTCAKSSNCVIGVGAEFTFLPDLQRCISLIDSGQPVQLQLRWNDPALECRHGAPKVRHNEISLLLDMLPHAASIFAVFVDPRSILIQSATIAPDGSAGKLQLISPPGTSCEMEFSARAMIRERLLLIRQGERLIEINFATPRTMVSVNGVYDQKLLKYDSTLRLQWGAFLSTRRAATANNPIVSLAKLQLHLQEQMEMLPIETA